MSVNLRNGIFPLPDGRIGWYQENHYGSLLFPADTAYCLFPAGNSCLVFREDNFHIGNIQKLYFRDTIHFIFTSAIFRNYISGILYILFAVMLIWYSVGRNRKPDCPAKIVTMVNNKKLVPVFLGVVNSLGFCPALLLILTKSATQGTITQSYLAFLGFFAGSSLYFLPLPLAGRFRKKKVFETIGTLATGLAGIIFIIKGITNLIGGIING